MTVLGSTAQDRDNALERTEAFERAHLFPLRRHPDLKRDGKQFKIERHEAQRMTGVYDIKLPFAHAHLLVTLALPIRRRQPPELYVGHQEGWDGFVPRLESLFRYDPDDPASECEGGEGDSLLSGALYALLSSAQVFGEL